MVTQAEEYRDNRPTPGGKCKNVEIEKLKNVSTLGGEKGLAVMNKQERYEQFLSEVALLIQDEHDEISVLANVAAALKDAFGFFWVGFYLVKEKEDGEPQLYLGPFQGPTACYRIRYGRGVCGTAWQQRQSVVVPDVEQFPGHIACSSLSRSEIVVPIFAKEGRVVGVLDIDSTDLATFDDTDRENLERLCLLLTKNIY